MRHIKRNLICIAVMATIALMGSGCFDDNQPTDPIYPESSFPFPDTAEKLMMNYKKAYDEMNIAEYRNALHSDFAFVFVSNSPVAPATGMYTRDEDLQSTTRMFNGELGHDMLNQVKPGVRDVEFLHLERLTDWEDVPETAPHYAGCIRAMYDARVDFVLNTDDSNMISVDSQQMFYLQSHDEIQQDGSTRKHYYLICQQDIEPVRAANEEMSWGGVKALYF